MNIVPAVADEVFPAGGVGSGFFFAPEPGVVGFGAGGFGAAVFVFECERDGATGQLLVYRRHLPTGRGGRFGGCRR